MGEETVRCRGDHMGTTGAVGPPPTATATDWHGRMERSCWPAKEEDGRDGEEDDRDP
jgi:hypothetical protein